MKTRLLTGILLSLNMPFFAKADISISLPQDSGLDYIQYYYAPINQYANAKSRSERGLVVDSVKVENSKAMIKIPENSGNYMFGCEIASHDISLYGTPNDNISLNIESINPFDYILGGSPLADAMNDLNKLSNPVMNKFYAASPEQRQNPEYMQNIVNEYNIVQTDFILADPQGLAAPIALMNLEGNDFIANYEKNEKNFTSSIVFPLIKQQYDREKRNQELEKKQQALQSGEMDAPNFTLKDLEGKEISLSDFRGKWVILDFWGSWCPWCIKGFPELKETYEEYKKELEVIGIDCNESEADWRAGVKKYELPWVNVYNPSDSNVTSEYGVQGYPTKAIVDPEGKIRNITVGHDPNFFTILKDLMGK